MKDSPRGVLESHGCTTSFHQEGGRITATADYEGKTYKTSAIISNPPLATWAWMLFSRLVNDIARDGKRFVGYEWEIVIECPDGSGKLGFWGDFYES